MSGSASKKILSLLQSFARRLLAALRFVRSCVGRWPGGRQEAALDTLAKISFMAKLQIGFLELPVRMRPKEGRQTMRK